MTTETDAVAAALDAIRERDVRVWDARGNSMASVVTVEDAKDDVPRLRAAVEAAMRFHAPQETANSIRVCAFCSCAQGEAVRSPCPEVQAISAALLERWEAPGG